MRVLIAGGGTGGHLFPGMAVADAMIEAVPDTKVAFAGTDRGIEALVIPATPHRLFILPVMGMIGKGLAARLLALTVLPSAFMAAWRVLGEFKPDLVIGVGGYASAPVLFMAGLKRVPRVILEQNAIPGVTNRIFGPGVDRVFLTFEEAKHRFKSGRFSCPGNPVRADLLAGGKAGATKPGKTSGKKRDPHILVFGGSQGARAINDAVIEALPLLLKQFPKLTVTHQTGRNDHERVAAAVAKLDQGLSGRVTVAPFIDDMGAAYAAADLVVCRSGATTAAELTALGKPSLLVPFPQAAHGHQRANAQSLVNAGAAQMLLQEDLSGATLAKTIESLLTNQAQLATMGDAARALGRPDAARDIVTECLELVSLPQKSQR